jgi:hypothetical protein
MSELEALRKRVEELEKASAPKEPFVPKAPHVPYDPMKNISMPKSALNDLVRAIPNPQAIANDHLGKSTALPTVAGVSPGHNRANESKPVSLAVPGVDLCDRIVDAQDKIDRRERARQLGVKPEA